MLSDGESEWAAFVCDARPRVARVFPNGRATLSTTSLGGDYVASIPARDCMCFRLYWWPVSSSDRGRWATRLTVNATVSSEGARLEMLVHVDCVVVRRPHGAMMEMWTPAQRLASVEQWTPAGLAVSATYANVLQR